MNIFYKVAQVTPVMANAGAYLAGDQVGVVNTISDAALDTMGAVKLDSVVLIDKAKQKQPLDIFFFDLAPTLSVADNGVFSITDAEMLKCVGVVSILAADYADSAANSVATKTQLGRIMQAYRMSKDLFCVVVARGGATYASGDLVFKFGLVQR